MRKITFTLHFTFFHPSKEELLKALEEAEKKGWMTSSSNSPIPCPPWEGKYAGSIFYERKTVSLDRDEEAQKDFAKKAEEAKKLLEKYKCEAVSVYIYPFSVSKEMKKKEETS